MLDVIRDFFVQNIASDKPEFMEHRLQLATAALLLEMMQQDHQVKDSEREAVLQTLKEKFDLDENETLELVALAQQEAEDAVDYHQFTSLIAREYSPDDKIRVIENLWKIAFADGHLDALEEHMIRRIADLIYVSHRDFIKSRLNVERHMTAPRK